MSSIWSQLTGNREWQLYFIHFSICVYEKVPRVNAYSGGVCVTGSNTVGMEVFTLYLQHNSASGWSQTV